MMKTESFLIRLGKLGSPPGQWSWEWKKYWVGLEGKFVTSAFTLGASFLWGVNSASRKSEKHRVAPKRRGLKQSSRTPSRPASGMETDSRRLEIKILEDLNGAFLLGTLGNWSITEGAGRCRLAPNAPT